MEAAPVLPDRETLSAQYERLREAAMATDPTPRPAPGLGVFLLRGMLEWVEALPALGTGPEEPRPPTDPRSGPPLAGARSDLVPLLANMVLSHLGGGPGW